VRWFLLLALLVFIPATQGQGCGLQLEFTNTPPVVTWVHVSPSLDGIVDVTMWIYDLEQQPVDLDVTWTLDGVDQGPITLAAGGHGVLGLTTNSPTMGPEGRPDPDGQPHLIRWALPEAVTAEARLQLHVLADDRESVTGAITATSAEGFTAQDGVPVVSPLSAP
jgi:hypothetical protein